MSDIMTILNPIGEMYKAGEYNQALEALGKIWEALPAPKESVLNSQIVVSSGVIIALKNGSLDVAKEWAQRGLIFSGNVNLAGESEFFCGEVAVARGEMDEAALYFKKVRKMSGKRLFKGKDPRYLELSS
jgi:hypothetical protein